MSTQTTGEAIPLKAKRKSRGSEVVTTATAYDFDQYMKKPKDKTLGQLVYDRQNGKLFGRTPKNWGELMVFYGIFYMGLAALFAVCMKGLLMTLSESEPKWKLSESLIGINPGLGFRPIAEDVDQGSLIWYDATNQTQIGYWTTIIDNFLEDSKRPAKNQKICDFDDGPNKYQVCKLDTSKFGRCVDKEAYGYNNSAPCIFLKLNRIYGWVPDYYDDPEDLPEGMPATLVAHIKSLKPSQRKQVWVSCKGEDGSDREILGDMEYYPTYGFPSYFYPYTNLPGYVSPLVAVKFLRPAVNQIINIECRAWAKNINYATGRERLGSVHFELMIDAKTN